MSAELVRYDRMCSAIAACHEVDEVKDLHDKAFAMEIYAKQARNREAERMAAMIRLRAERRAGEMLRELQRTPPAVSGAMNGRAEEGPATVAGPSEYRAALDRAVSANALRGGGRRSQRSPRRNSTTTSPIPTGGRARAASWKNATR